MLWGILSFLHAEGVDYLLPRLLYNWIAEGAFFLMSSGRLLAFLASRSHLPARDRRMRLVCSTVRVIGGGGGGKRLLECCQGQINALYFLQVACKKRLWGFFLFGGLMQLEN